MRRPHKLVPSRTASPAFCEFRFLTVTFIRVDFQLSLPIPLMKELRRHQGIFLDVSSKASRTGA